MNCLGSFTTEHNIDCKAEHHLDYVYVCAKKNVCWNLLQSRALPMIQQSE